MLKTYFVINKLFYFYATHQFQQQYLFYNIDY